MKKRLLRCCLPRRSALTLAACGENQRRHALPDEPPEPVAEQPATDDEWTALHADDVLLRTEPFTPSARAGRRRLSYTAIRTRSMTAA